MIEEVKKCPMCNEEKHLCCFQFRNKKKNTKQSYCKICRSQIRKEYCLLHREEINLKSKEYRNTHQEKIRNYRIKNSEKIKEKKRIYRQNDAVKKTRNRKEKQRRHMDPSYKLRINVSNTITKILKSHCSTKRGISVFSILPYTPLQLKEHLEKQFTVEMSWDNYGTYWHIDHIYPKSKLPFDSLEHPNFVKCWSLENLRPLEATENLKKGNKILGL